MPSDQTPRSGLLSDADLLIEKWPRDFVGGQHVGLGSPGVKVTHEPSGLVAISQHCRSQSRNRAVAIAMIEGGLTCPEYQP